MLQVPFYRFIGSLTHNECCGAESTNDNNGIVCCDQGTFLCRVMSPLASLIKSQMLKHFAVCALQEHRHAG